MKKLTIITVATLLSVPAFAGGSTVSNSAAAGVNYNSQSQIGVNNVAAAAQDASHFGSVANLENTGGFNHGEVKVEDFGFAVGSIVDSGNGGDGGAGGKADASAAAGQSNRRDGQGKNAGSSSGKVVAVGGNGGAGGAGSASLSTSDSGNVTIDNKTRSSSSATLTTTTVTNNVKAEKGATVAVDGSQISSASKGGVSVNAVAPAATITGPLE